MAQRHSNDKLQAECTRLHACAATAMASATKHRQLAAALKQASPASVKKNLFSPTSTIIRTSAEHHFHDRRSSAGSSSHASTEIRDDYDEEEGEGEDSGLEDADSSSEGDENESGGNTPVASPEPSNKLHKPTTSFSPSCSMTSTTSTSGSSTGSSTVGAVEKDVWNTVI